MCMSEGAMSRLPEGESNEDVQCKAHMTHTSASTSCSNLYIPEEGAKDQQHRAHREQDSRRLSKQLTMH